MNALVKFDNFTYSMEACIEGIAVEMSVFANAIDTIKKFVPSLIRGVREKAKFIFSKLGKMDNITKDQRKAIELVKSTEYTALSELAVYVAEGYKGNLVEYVDALDKAVDHMYTVVNVVKEYKTFLSIILTNKEKRLSVDDSRYIYNNSQTDAETVDALVNKFFVKNSYKTKVKFGDVFDRNSEVEVFIRKMEALRKKVDTIDLNALKNDVDSASDLLEMFIKNVNKGDINDVSPEVLKNLSTGAYQIAKDVEWFAASRYRIMVSTNTVNTLVELLTKLNIN